MDITVAFPGLGIGEFELSRAINPDGNFTIYWYGVIITLGIIFAFCYTAFRGKYEGIGFDHITDVALWTVIVGVVGARLYYVLTSLDSYIPKPFHLLEFLKNVVNLRRGGLAIYGAIICGALTILIVTKLKKINTLKFLDMTAPGVMIGQLMGRWGNFFNGEAYGAQVSEGHPLYFMRMGLISDNTLGDFGTFDMVYVHPTFLYESLWNFCGFLLINALYKKKKFNGQIVCMYLAWYGFGRMFIEGLRTDSLYVGPFRISQVVGGACFLVFGGLLIAGLIYSKKMASKTELCGFEKLLVPSLVEKPVFFEKKEKAADKSKETKASEARSEEKSEEKNDGIAEQAPEQVAEQSENQEQQQEESENGTDH